VAQVKYYFSRPLILFLLALLTGVILPQGAEIGKALILPALTIILTITLLQMPRGFFRKPGPLLSPATWGNIMNYIVLGNFIIWSSIFLIREEGLWIGMVLIAAVPPAVSIISLSKSFRAEAVASYAGLAGAYAGALIIAPLIGIGFLKYIPLNYTGIILLVLELIVLPLALSRLAVDKDWDKIIEPYEEIINDWCFFIVYYTLVAGSRYLIIRRIPEIILIALIAVASTFFLGYAIEKISIFYRVPKEKITSLRLLGTLKNYGLAGGIALTVFNKVAALPALIFIICMFIYELWLKYKMKNINITVPAAETKEQSRV
jgi:bile acid:Na+ symporter, BASS family